MNVRTLALIAVAVWTPLIINPADSAPRLKRDVQRSTTECLSQSQILSKLRREGYRPVKRRTRSGRVLFFDEADALFGKRTGVRDSHDKYARRAAPKAAPRPRSASGAYLVTAVRHNKRVDLTVDRCTGRVLKIQAAREALKALKCLSKSSVYQKLKTNYPYLKAENVSGPYNTPKGKAYKAQTLVKEGPQWCQVKLTVSCYNAKLLEYDRLDDTCIY